MIVEHRLHERLTIVERTLHRNGMHVRFGRRRHHATLHVRHAPLGKQDRDIDALRTAECFDGSATRVATRGTHDRRTPPMLFEHVVHETRDELHGDVFERERRPMEEFEHPRIPPRLHERRDGRMPE